MMWSILKGQPYETQMGLQDSPQRFVFATGVFFCFFLDYVNLRSKLNGNNLSGNRIKSQAFIIQCLLVKYNNDGLTYPRSVAT